MNTFNKFTSIDSFAQVWLMRNRKMDITTVEYRAKIKLHGTNAGIRIVDGVATAQKRTSDVTTDADNAGFARWVDDNAAAWSRCGLAGSTVVFFGEWAGSGIQRNDAITLIRQKMLFLFALQVDDKIITDPATIERMIPDLDDVVVLPWHGDHHYHIDFNDTGVANEMVEALNVDVESIGERDPFVWEMFGVDGIGEGLVITPVTGAAGMPRDEYAQLIFKAKSEAHRVKQSSSAVKMRIEVPGNVHEFVDTFVTEPRLMQGLTEGCGGEATKQQTAAFLKWFGSDVKKESVVELEDMGLEWKQVAGFVNKAAVTWFLKKCNEVPS